MYVDSKHTWHVHIKHIINKLNRSLYIINQVKNCLSCHTLKTLYYSLIHPYIEYGIILWRNTYTTYINKIDILQKKAIRLINKKPYNYHSNDLFNRSKILKINKLQELKMNLYMFRYKHGMLSPIANKIFAPIFNTHRYNTRKNEIIYHPTHNIGRLANNYWSLLPHHIQNASSLPCFKKKVKILLLSKQSPS